MMGIAKKLLVSLLQNEFAISVILWKYYCDKFEHYTKEGGKPFVPIRKFPLTQETRKPYLCGQYKCFNRGLDSTF
jgi:hypothetical protein